MPRTPDMRLSIDLDQYLRLGLIERGLKVRFDAWLRAEQLHDKKVVHLTLGEGHVVVERYAEDDKGRIQCDENGEAVKVVARYPVTTPPPAEAFGAAQRVEASRAEDGPWHDITHMVRSVSIRTGQDAE